MLLFVVIFAGSKILGMKGRADEKTIELLQRQILNLQGGRKISGEEQPALGLGSIEQAFPARIFPRGAIHEFISATDENAACTNGFLSVVAGRLMRQRSACLWISTRRHIFPPALKVFGLEPERILFIDVRGAKEALWAIEEALKCDALAAVVGEIGELGFNESRRLQLAVERSQVTGLIHRHRPKTENTVACVSRWKIRSAASKTTDGLPGVGFPRWHIELQKVRNGRPGNWEAQWSPSGFEITESGESIMPQISARKTG